MKFRPEPSPSGRLFLYCVTIHHLVICHFTCRKFHIFSPPWCGMNTTLSLSPVYLPQGKWYLKLSFGDSCWLCCIDRSESLCWTGSICGSLRKSLSRFLFSWDYNCNVIFYRGSKIRHVFLMNFFQCSSPLASQMSLPSYIRDPTLKKAGFVCYTFIPSFVSIYTISPGGHESVSAWQNGAGTKEVDATLLMVVSCF